MTRAEVLGLSAASYERHPLHASGQFTETNCYVDLWIEVLHAMGLDPVAALSFPLEIDFEGDQWTFIKPPAYDLAELYGLSIEELNVWRPLREHIVTQAARGRLVLVEVDSYHLPDTAATDYHQNHVKTTIAVDAIDVAAAHLGYFHGPGYFELSGEDFAGLLPDDPAKGSFPLPPYVEIVKTSREQTPSARDLAARARALFARHLARRPRHNPFDAFAATVAEQLVQAGSRGIEEYHRYAFATFRQFGAAFELCSVHMKWLGDRGERGLSLAGSHFEALASGTKTLVLKGARAAMSGRTSTLVESVHGLASSWQSAMSLLDARRETGGAEVAQWHA